MGKEFNLSEKRDTTRCSVCYTGVWYKEEDVKELIKRLKEPINDVDCIRFEQETGKDYRTATTEEVRIWKTNKLAGDKLIWK